METNNSEDTELQGPEQIEFFRKKYPIEAYFESRTKRYWYINGDNRWSDLSKEDMLIWLEGFWKVPPGPIRKKSKLTVGELLLMMIRNEKCIEFAGPVAGQRMGVKIHEDQRYLVTKGPNIIEPKQGSWATIKELGDRLFGGGDQMPYVWGWCKNGAEGVQRNVLRRGQIFVMAGPAGAGKSFWQRHVLSPILGGRSARPAQFMFGGTGFNEDIIKAEHLMLEDENTSTDLNSRREFGSAIKNFTVNTGQRLHAKGKNAIVVDSSHWLSMSLNDDMESLQVLPPIDPSLQDKIQLFRTGKAFVKDVWPLKGNADLEIKIAEEIPAFLYYLLNEHQVPNELVDPRMGVIAYQHPELVKDIMSLAPESELDYCINLAFKGQYDKKETIEFTSVEIFQQLEGDKGTEKRTARMFKNSNTLGKYLERLCRSHSDKYSHATESEKRGKPWKIDFSQPGPQDD